jgi:short-subunit dehydrogenase
MTFANQVAVVTGASSGIGWALAKALAAEGCKVGLLARRRPQLEKLAAEIESAGGSAAFAVADVTDRPRVLAALADLAARLGPVDLLVANAGLGAPTLLEPFNVDDIEKQFRVNVLGVVYAIEAVLPEMLRRGRGHIAAVSSLGAYKGLPGESAYCASKAALSSFMDGLRVQLRGRGVAVTTLCPGFVRTPMTAANEFSMPFVLEADEAARRMLRAIRRRRKVYNFPWPTWLLMQLSRLAPDWALAWVMHGYNENPPMPPPAEPAAFEGGAMLSRPQESPAAQSNPNGDAKACRPLDRANSDSIRGGDLAWFIPEMVPHDTATRWPDDCPGGRPPDRGTGPDARA